MELVLELDYLPHENKHHMEKISFRMYFKSIGVLIITELSGRNTIVTADRWFGTRARAN